VTAVMILWVNLGDRWHVYRAAGHGARARRRAHAAAAAVRAGIVDRAMVSRMAVLAPR